MSKLPFPILFEDYYLLVINKPANLVVEFDSRHPSVEQFVKAYFQAQHPNKKTPFVGIVHRLDRPVSGVLLIAKTKQAFVECGKQFENRTTEKKYLAQVSGAPPLAAGLLTHWLKKDHAQKRSWIFDQPGKDRVECSLVYKKLASDNKNNFLEIKLLTGRFHQIRAQLSFIGCFISGDAKYGSKEFVGENRIALHAISLSILHPKTNENMLFEAPLPDYFSKAIKLG